MRLLKTLWKDDAGIIMSAEAVMVGTIAAVGLTAGVTAVSHAVNEELKDVGFAIRSLDQSYAVPGMKSGHAWTAASHFQQEPVEKSHRKLAATIREAEKHDADVAERLERQLEKQKKSKGDRRKSAPKKRRPEDGRADESETPEPERTRGGRTV